MLLAVCVRAGVEGTVEGAESVRKSRGYGGEGGVGTARCWRHWLLDMQNRDQYAEQGPDVNQTGLGWLANDCGQIPSCQWSSHSTIPM